MSDSALSKAWKWSVEASPLLNAWRWLRHMGYPNRKAFAMLEAAGLPKPVDTLIRKTVSKSKLWANERAEIARELIAHAQDAIEAGRTGEEIASTFGDPKRIAKLMRRSMKRKRPLYWRAYRNMKRATWGMALVLIVGYGGLAARFYMGTPSVKRNYIAELNARNDGYTEDEKAWGVYASVNLEWEKISYALLQDQSARVAVGGESVLSEGVLQLPNLEQSHPDYSVTANAVRQFEPYLEQMREAAARRIVGLPVGFVLETVVDGEKTWETGIEPASIDDYREHAAIGILLPNLGIARKQSNLLIFDARLAMIEQDYDRAVDDVIAAMNLARQCNREPFFISRLIGIAIQDMVMGEFQSMLTIQPAGLTSKQIQRVASKSAEVNGQIDLGLESEQISFDDMLQRLYTDDGHGNGRVTSTGLAWFESMYWESNRRSDATIGKMLLEEETIKAFTQPMMLIQSEDRLTASSRYRQQIERARRVLRNGPEWIGLIAIGDHEIEKHKAKESVTRYSYVDKMTPAWTQYVNRSFQNEMIGKAFGVMLAVEMYQIEHGSLPESLNDIAVKFISCMPEDLMSPGDPIKYARSEQGYFLYSTGSDGDDDGGIEPKRDDEPYSNGRERHFGRRFRISFDTSAEEVLALCEQQGRPNLLGSDGPDGDWILIDMRRLPDTAYEPITGE